jgi:metallo-beta-lactamase class B
LPEKCPHAVPHRPRAAVTLHAFTEPDTTMRMVIPVTMVLGLLAPGAHAQAMLAVTANLANPPSCVSDPAWIAPQAPFRIYGNTWFVGPHGLGVFLLTAPTGDVLIDGGVPEAAPLIEANLRALGIELHDIKWILNSHAHCDHAGGIAQLARDTGAQVIASAADAPLLARGGRDDPHYADRFRFPPVPVSRTVTPGERVRLGDLLLTAHATPGHTRGNTTWTWTSCERGRCLHIVDVGSLSAPGFTLVGNTNYPETIADFRRSFARVAALPCDIAIAPHPAMVDFWTRVAKRDKGNADALIDTTLCRSYANDERQSFEAQLKEEQAKAGTKK